jgi:hypothetical protein
LKVLATCGLGKCIGAVFRTYGQYIGVFGAWTLERHPDKYWAFVIGLADAGVGRLLIR